MPEHRHTLQLHSLVLNKISNLSEGQALKPKCLTIQIIRPFRIHSRHFILFPLTIFNSTSTKSINVTTITHLTKLPRDGDLDGGGGVQQPRPQSHPRLCVASGHTPHAAVILAAERLLSLHFIYIFYVDIFLLLQSDLYDVPVEVPGYGGGGAGGVGGAGCLQGAAEAVAGRHAPNVGAGGAGQ